MQENSESIQYGLFIIAIVLVALSILFWFFIFSILGCIFFKVRRTHIFYTFKDGLVRNRFTVVRYYMQNIIL